MNTNNPLVLATDDEDRVLFILKWASFVKAHPTAFQPHELESVLAQIISGNTFVVGGALPPRINIRAMSYDETATLAAAGRAVMQKQEAEAGRACWLIWSKEHDGWWGPGECGYTRDMSKAGQYTQAHAERLCKKANFAHHFGGVPMETMVRAPETLYRNPFAEE